MFCEDYVPPKMTLKFDQTPQKINLCNTWTLPYVMWQKYKTLDMMRYMYVV